MIRRHVLAALAEGVAAGEDDAARVAVQRTEWLLRGRVKRRLERGLIDAALATNELDSFGDPEAARHVQRVAALELAGTQGIDVTDRAKVAEAYGALPVVRPTRAPIATIVFGVALLATATALVFGVRAAAPSRRASQPAEGYVRPLPPPSVGAFKDGGVPVHDAAIEKLLIDDFTEHVIEIDRAHVDPAARATLASAPAIAARGQALVAAWSDMLDMLDRWALAPRAGREFKDVSRELRAKVRVVSDHFAAAGVGIYLEGDVITSGARSQAIIYSYRVEQVVFLDAGNARRRVLSLRRLDKLNLSHGMLGMQSEELGDPVLLLDQIDEHVTTTVLPVLATGAGYPFGDETWTGTAQLSAEAGLAVRRELANAFSIASPGSAGARSTPGGSAESIDANDATEVAGLLAERMKLVERWRDALQRRNLRLASVESVFLPPAMLDTLDGRVSSSQLARARAIEDRLAELGAARIASRGHDFVAATVRRHEAQHGLDDDRDEPLRYPAALEEYLGPELDGDGDPRRSVQRARAELSAYLSQIANDPATPQLALWHVARNVFHRRRWGSAESYAGVIIVEGLGRHLGIVATQPVIHGGAVDRDRLLAPALGLARAPSERLRAAARVLWRELYDEPLVPIVDR